MKRLTWVDIAGGQLALGHKPGRRVRKLLDAGGCTLVVSLLSHKESTASTGPHRVRLPLDGAGPLPASRDAEVAALLQRITQELSSGGRVYLHCSAGLHRTGMIAYALLRSLGHEADEAVSGIRQLRALTADELTAERVAWAEGFCARAGGANAR